MRQNHTLLKEGLRFDRPAVFCIVSHLSIRRGKRWVAMPDRMS